MAFVLLKLRPLSMPPGKLSLGKYKARLKLKTRRGGGKQLHPVAQLHSESSGRCGMPVDCCNVLRQMSCFTLKASRGVWTSSNPAAPNIKPLAMSRTAIICYGWKNTHRLGDDKEGEVVDIGDRIRKFAGEQGENIAPVTLHTIQVSDYFDSDPGDDKRPAAQHTLT
jgi:hypothetical protein